MFPHTRSRLAGPPPVLPALLDRASERWWRTAPRVRFLLAGAAACLVVLAGVAHAATDPDGPPVEVWIAARDLLPGEVLTPADVERRPWPSALAPSRARTEPVGTVTAALPRGGVVTDLHLGDLGIAASVPPDRVGIAIPVEQLPELAPGTRIDLVGPGPDGQATVLARDATVLADDGTAQWMAVDRADAVAVSGAVASATIAVVILGR